jgi:phage recombination protein Bet
MSNALTTLTRTLATKLDMGDGADLIHTLKATAFKGEVSDAQMTALLVVANQYALNPWTKEIYAFPDKNNGIVPVVGVDGWSRIINSHPQFDGIEFEQATNMLELPGAKPAPEWMGCRIFRKDRSRPIVVREYLDEVYRPPFNGKYGTVNGPWQSHTKRFLRHKSMIQCARLAFGFGGIYDQDEAERIVDATEKHMGPAEVVAPVVAPPAAPPKFYDATKFDHNLPKWAETIAQGRKSAADYIAFAQTRGEPFTEEQKARLLSVKAAPAVTYADLAGRLRNAQSPDELDEVATMIGAVENPQHRQELTAIYEDTQASFA